MIIKHEIIAWFHLLFIVAHINEKLIELNDNQLKEE